MRIPAENGHAAGSSGYWRLPSRPPQLDVNVDSDVDGLTDDLPAALEQVTRLGLKSLERILRAPLDNRWQFGSVASHSGDRCS